MLDIVALGVIMLGVLMLGVITLRVVAPTQKVIFVAAWLVDIFVYYL